MAPSKGSRYIHFTEDEVAEIKRLAADGMSGRRIGQQFNICPETALKIVRDEWTPRDVKLPHSNEVLYMDYLLLGSFLAVARKYGVSDRSVKKRLKVYMGSIGETPLNVSTPRKLPSSDRQVYFDYLDLGTYSAVAKKYGTASRTARMRILKIVESGKAEALRRAWEED